MSRHKRAVSKLILAGGGALVLLILVCTEAEAVSINWGTAGNPIYGEGGVGSDLLARGDVVQLICDRAQDGIDPPGKDGMPTGDDELIHTSYIGHGSFFEGEFSDNVLTGIVGIGDFLYVRAWNDSVLLRAARFGDTRQHDPQEWVVDNSIQFTLNATENGSWAATFYKLKILSKRLRAFRPGASPGVADLVDLGDGAAILYLNRPNPFSSSTMLGFSLVGCAASSRAELKIYAVSGSLVRNLFSAESVQGDRWVIWDGKDDSGSDAGSGIYICRLRIFDGTRTAELLAKLVYAR
ncbi:hypothetical protein E3J62_05070 [candidate division TA06 bacterium]|uniref:FlgD Ig-like domain-containing protein n=1 Tax=candidate division TA06 bacterium TaxID=2250710 RepID=A0A523UUK0_UNCT6|nr:MAG: hypothetical protein E3J62_05070 [candidate division TA06 bacterium]